MWNCGNVKLSRTNVRSVVACLLLTALSQSAFSVSVCYEGRYLDADGNVKANVQVPATVRAYASEDAAEALGSASARMATDAEGRFATMAEGLEVPESYSTFWIGVTPQGGSEIRPRMRVSPAPFAVVASKAEMVVSDSAVTIDGDLKANAIANSNATADDVVLTGDATLRGSVEGVKDLYIRTLDLNGGSASIMRTKAPNGSSTQWDQFDADYSLDLTDTTGVFGSYNQTESKEFTAEDDGIVMVMICVAISVNDDLYWVKGTLSNGDFLILNDTKIGVTGSDKSRFFTFPVRKGNKVSLSLHNHRGLIVRDVKSWAKMKVVYFGAN